MEAEGIAAILTALAAALGAWLELRRSRNDQEIGELRERCARLEARCDALERRP
jgi:hypothetical protein